MNKNKEKTFNKNYMKNDQRSCEHNLCNCVRSLKKIQDFNGIWTLNFVQLTEPAINAE